MAIYPAIILTSTTIAGVYLLTRIIVHKLSGIWNILDSDDEYCWATLSSMTENIILPTEKRKLINRAATNGKNAPKFYVF